MNGFQCNFPNATSNRKLATPKVPTRYVAAAMVVELTIFTYCERVVVAQNCRILRRTMLIARMVRSSLCTGIRRSATTCSRARIHPRCTTICTTSVTALKTTSLKTRQTRARRVLIRPFSSLIPPKPPRLCRHRGPRLLPLHRRPRLTVSLTPLGRPCLHLPRNALEAPASKPTTDSRLLLP